jgi:hypothetical protein
MAALDYVPRQEPDHTWAILVPREGTGAQRSRSVRRQRAIIRVTTWISTHPTRRPRSSGSSVSGRSGSTTGTANATTPTSSSSKTPRAIVSV